MNAISKAAGVAAAAAGMLACAAAPAGADSGRLADFGLALSSTAPGSPTGMTVHVLLRAEGDPEAKPSPLRAAVIRLPDGLRFDTGALPECTASDDEIRALGPDACPPETKLTVGEFSAITGFGPPVDPLMGDDHVFNGHNEIIEIISARGSSASPGFDRLTIEGTTLTAHPPMAPGGPPDGESAVRSIDFAIPVRSEAGRSLITTPPACPAGGEWVSRATFGFADGNAETVGSATPCTRPAGQARPRLRVTVRPRRIPAEKHVRLRFRVRSGAARCVSGATVLLRGVTARTDSRGRATLATLFHQPGRRLARVTKPGCGPAHAAVRVVR
jgi:hypothetical protein